PIRFFLACSLLPLYGHAGTNLSRTVVCDETAFGVAGISLSRPFLTPSFGLVLFWMAILAMPSPAAAAAPYKPIFSAGNSPAFALLKVLTTGWLSRLST